jgi:hypothetical protein
MESASPRERLKLWVIDYFRVLPTDPRFKALREDQMELLFCHFLSSPTDEQYRQSHRAKITKKEMIDTMPKGLMKKMGYSEEDMEEITQELIAGGGPTGG